MSENNGNHERKSAERISKALYSTDWEGLVIGSCWMNRTERTRALEILQPDDFADQSHAKIWRVMVELGTDARIDTVAEELHRRGLLDSIGGMSGMVDIHALGIEQLKLEGICRMLKRKAIDRRAVLLAETLCTLLELGMDAAGEQANKIAVELNELERARQMNPGEHLSRFGDILAEVGGFDALLSTPRDLVPMPWRNDVLHGLERGQLVVVAGRTSMGKTVIATQFAHSGAAAKQRTLFVSLEMGKGEMLKRFLAPIAGVPNCDLQSGNLTPSERERVHQAAAKLDSMPLEICVELRSVEALDERVALAERSGDPYGLVVVDYLGLMTAAHASENRTQEVSAITRKLKIIAAEHRCVLVVAAQLRRPSQDKSDDREPTLSDLRDSGSIEQDADVVAFIHRPGYYKRMDDISQQNAAKLLIRKQRNGPTGTIALRFHPEFLTFTSDADESEKRNEQPEIDWGTPD